MSCSWIWHGGQCWMGILCLSHHKCVILLVSHRDVQNMVCVSHILQLLICSAAYWQWWTDCGWNGFEFILSTVTNFSKSNDFQSFTLTNMGNVYHICLAMSKRTFCQCISMQCFDKKCWPPHCHSRLLLWVGATNDLFTDAFHISNDCNIDKSKEICVYISYTMADISVWKYYVNLFVSSVF